MVLKANGSLMKVESLTLQLSLIGLECQFFVFFLSDRLKRVLLYMYERCAKGTGSPFRGARRGGGGGGGGGT